MRTLEDLFEIWVRDSFESKNIKETLEQALKLGYNLALEDAAENATTKFIGAKTIPVVDKESILKLKL